MSKRNWGVLAAFAGLAALVCVAGFGAYFGALYGPDHKHYDAVGSNATSENTYEGVSESLPDLAGIPGPVERAIANPQPYSGQDHEKRDLAAQEGMAVWAFYMALFAGLTAIVTMVGTYFIAVQVKLTREAVVDTGEATEAMVRQNELTVAAQRPWLGVNSWETGQIIDSIVDDKPVKSGFVIYPRWTNNGQSPAIVRSLFTKHSLGLPGAIPEFEFEVAGEEDASVIIGPNVTQDAPPQFLNDAATEALRDREAVLYVYSRVEYFDTFNPDVPHVTEVCVRIASMGGSRLRNGQAEMAISVNPVGRQNTAN